MNISDNVKRLREAAGINQAELASALEVSQGMVSQIERGSKIPSLILGLSMARVLGCTINDLVEGC